MIFLDTGFLFALFCERDSHHQRVRAVLEPYRGRRLKDLVVTTNHVVSETTGPSPRLEAWRAGRHAAVRSIIMSTNHEHGHRRQGCFMEFGSAGEEP